jgi:hypothetical protein
MHVEGEKWRGRQLPFRVRTRGLDVLGVVKAAYVIAVVAGARR